MTASQAFKFLSKFASAHDAKIIAENRRLYWWNAPFVARALARGVPVAKIIHRKWFYGLQFFTTRATLDPRPDSETLVEAVLGTRDKGRGTRVLDMGTGTGCLICAIVKNIPGATGIGIDKSWRARRVAKKNVRALGLSDRIEIRRGTFANPPKGAFDIIVANPPYIRTDESINRGAEFDPKMALFGGTDGLKFYRQIAASTPRARMFLEIGAGQSAAVRRIFSAAEWRFVKSYKDLSGIVRVLEFA